MFLMPAMYNLKIKLIRTHSHLEPKMIKFLGINLIEIQDLYTRKNFLKC